MGWWKAHPENATLAELSPGFEDTETLWGDGPADIMDTAIDGIREEFRKHMGREPMVSELLAGVRFYTNVLDEVK